MNNKKQIKISGYIIVIAVVLVLSIIFLIAVQVPFLQQKEGYETKHASATSKINYYNSYLSNASNVEASIAAMLEEYQTKNPILYSNGIKTPYEVRTILKTLKYTLTSLSVSAGNEDDQGRTTVEGGRLFSTGINFTFSGTREDLKKTLDYLELKANGSYYINNIDVEPAVDAGSTDGGSTTGVAGAGAKYNFSIEMSLYYFEKIDIEAAAVSASDAAESSAA